MHGTCALRDSTKQDGCAPRRILVPDRAIHPTAFRAAARRHALQRTNIANPQYFHKVVDCQYACPAHTNVPEYIRMIAQGRFTDAYMLNRESNVFPGILGRTCDRPCEPACRRGRLPEDNKSGSEVGKPVAICRLKRVAADHRGEIAEFLPKIPAKKNGKRIACVG